MKSKKLTLIFSIGLILVLVTSMLFAACAKEEAPAPAAPAVEVYPDRPIELIVPWSAGGGTDRIVRALAGTWGKYADVPLRVIDMPGGGGAEAHRFMANDVEVDGYTLTATSIPLLTIPLFREDAGFTLESFEPIFNIVGFAYIIGVHPDSPFETLQDLLDYVKANPGELTYNSSGTGSDSHIGMEIFLGKAGDLEMKHVPLEGGAEQLATLMGGHIDVTFGTYGSFVPAVVSGDVKALAVTGAERHTAFDAPTIKEVGVDFEYLSFRAILAPAGVPADRIAAIEAIGANCLADEGLIKMIGKLGETPMYMGSQELKDWLYKQRADFIPVVEAIKAAGG